MNATSTGSPNPSRSSHRSHSASGLVSGSTSGVRPNTAKRRWATAALVVVPLVLAGCQEPSYGASRGVTTQGRDTFRLWSGMMTTGIVVGGGVSLLILWAIFRYRRRSDVMPVQFHEHIPLEILYTVVPIIIVLVLFVFTVFTENNVDSTQLVNARTTSTGQPVVHITVTAFQWGWRFDYPGLNVGVAGATTNGPGGHGPQMVVPVGETVQITLVSDDVVHGFYMRDLNFSRYAQPGVTNVFDLNFTNTGTFYGQCTQFCGLYHAEMLFSIRSVSASAFTNWVGAEVTGGHVLQGSSAGAGATPPSGSRVNPGGGNSSAISPITTKAKASA